MTDWLLAMFFFFLFHVRSSTHSQPSVSILTFCACVCSRRRASINPLAQKKAAQRRDAKLTQLLAQNDEVRDADFIPPSSLQTRSERKSDTGKRGWKDVCERYFRGRCCWWWDGGSCGWMGGGKLGVAEEGGKKVCERKREEKCPVRLWLFRMACCQLLMTELK